LVNALDKKTFAFIMTPAKIDPMKTSTLEEYLQPSKLCDFDRSPEIRTKATELTEDCRTTRQKFQRLFAFVRELPYGLEDWNVTASETLAKGWGDVLRQEQPVGSAAPVSGHPREVSHLSHKG